MGNWCDWVVAMLLAGVSTFGFSETFPVNSEAITT